jgi:hypothetical protein
LRLSRKTESGYSLTVSGLLLYNDLISQFALPTEGFGYKWCPAIRWEDLIAKKSFTIRCPHTDPKEAAFRFQAWVQTDINDSVARSICPSALPMATELTLPSAGNIPKLILNFVLHWSLKTYYPTICSTESTTRIPIRIGGAIFEREV